MSSCCDNYDNGDIEDFALLCKVYRTHSGRVFFFNLILHQQVIKVGVRGFNNPDLFMF